MLQPQSLLRQLRSKGQRHRTIAPPWRGYALHAMTFSAGCEQPAYPAYDFQGLKRGQTQWALFQFTLAGSGMLRYEKQTMPVHKGQAMLLTLPHDHRYWLPPNQHWSFFYLCMQGSEILRAWQQTIQQSGPLLTLPTNAPPLQKATQLCHDILADKIDSPWSLSAQSYDLAMSLVAFSQQQHTQQQPHTVAHLPSADSSPQNQTRTRALPIQKAISLARQHPGDHLNVAKLAAAAGLSRHHFSRLFSASEGMGPGEYLARVRLRLAVRLLQTTEQPIKAIARHCGYDDANYFAKAFRKAYGLSPRDFRTKGLGRPATHDTSQSHPS